MIKLVRDDFLKPEPVNVKLLHEIKGKVDLVLTDVPYNIADKGKVTKAHGKLWSTAESWGDQFKDSFTPKEYDEFIKAFLRRCFVLLKPGGSLVTFVDDKYSGVMIRFAEKINLEAREKNPAQPRGFVHKKNVHFVKVNCVPKIRAYNYASAVEVAVWLVKPRLGKGSSKAKPEIFNYQKPSKARRLFDADGKDAGIDVRGYHNDYSSNVFFYNIGGGKVSDHPTEKYADMLRPLIRTHSNEGSLVLDPFFGSGSAALVCLEMGRNFVGFEILEKWHAIASDLVVGAMGGKS